MGATTVKDAAAGLESVLLTMPADLEHKTAARTAGVLLDVDDDTGLVEALVSITGVVDEVNDRILPGAYRDTLIKRRPKGVFSHDWNRWVARTEQIEEWLPGDSRLPAKTPDGKAWPKEAGALYVKCRMNLNTDEGRNAYENVKFFSETGECEWSIGYLVPAGGATKAKDGVRNIKRLDLFEYSPVLFGAAPMSSTLAVKSRVQRATQTKGAAADVVNAETDGDVDWAAVEPLALEAVAGLDDEPDDVEGKRGKGVEVKYDTSPVGSPGDRENWVDQVGGLPKFIRAIAHALIRDGRSEEAAIRIAVAQVRRWASGEGDVTAKTRSKAQAALAEWERKKAQARATPNKKDVLDGAPPLLTAYDPRAEVKSVEPVDEQPPGGLEPVDKAEAGANGELDSKPLDERVEGKVFPHLAGSYEERHAAIRQAVTEALLGEVQTQDTEGADAAISPLPRREWDHVSINATFPDRVIVTRMRWRGAEDEETWEVPYTFDDETDEVTLGEPQPVRLVVTASVEGEDPGPGEVADVPEPVAAGIDAAAVGVKWLAEMAQQTKAGRVLSGANENRLRTALEYLIAVLAAAGIEVNSRAEDPGDAVVDTTAPSARGEAAERTEPQVKAGPPMLDPDAVAASLDAYLESL